MFLRVLFTLFFCSPVFADQAHYKMYCLYTPLYENMLNNYFLPSLKDDFEMVIKEYPQDCPLASFRTEGWNVTTLHKLEMLRDAVLENWGQVFFYSDIDIIFLKPILDISLECLGDKDFVAQESWPYKRVNSGFFVIRANANTLKLFTTAYDQLQRKVYVSDQPAVQGVLESMNRGEIIWGLLPSELYPIGRCILTHPTDLYSKNSEIRLTDSMILFHATCCIGLENKCDFLERVQEEFSRLNKGPGV